MPTHRTDGTSRICAPSQIARGSNRWLGTNQKVGESGTTSLSCGRPGRSLRWTWLNHGISTTHGLSFHQLRDFPADSHGGGVACRASTGFIEPELRPATMLRNCASSISCPALKLPEFDEAASISRFLADDGEVSRAPNPVVRTSEEFSGVAR